MSPQRSRLERLRPAFAAAALIGLLFVAVTLRPESVFGADATPAARTLAGSAFTGLVNAFFVSSLALVPKVNLGWVATVMAVVSLDNTVKLNRRVRGEGSQRIILAFSVVAYLAPLGEGSALVLRPRDATFVYDFSYLVIASFAVALGRAWALLQGRHVRGQAESRAASMARPDGAARGAHRHRVASPGWR